MQIPFRWAALRGRYYVHLVQMHGPFPNLVRVGVPLFGGLSICMRVVVENLGNEGPAYSNGPATAHLVRLVIRHRDRCSAHREAALCCSVSRLV